MRRLASAFALIIVLAPALGVAQDTASVLETSRRIIAGIDERELMTNLEYLTDVIGPRVTATPRLERANEWTAQRFREYGLQDVRLENWPFGRRWARGTATAKIVEPSGGLPLIVYSAGFAPGTGGAVQGDVKYVKGETMAELQVYKGALGGAIVLLAEPADVSKRPSWDPYPWEQRVKELEEQRRKDKENPDFTNKRVAFLKDEGAIAVVRDSDKDWGLMNMGGAGGQNPDTPVLPTVYTTHENYLLLWRLMKRGRTVVDLNVSNSLGGPVVDAYNVVAELRGTEKPDEIVVVGAHLDSWDLGTGTTDNGVNCALVLEVARALKVLNVRPSRTIRFVLFNGEEQGLLGSKAYVKMHKDRLAKHSAVLILDTGHGPVEGISLHGRDAVRPTMAAVLAPLNDLGVRRITLNYQGGTDHLPFLDEEVPAFAFQQDLTSYLKTHHSESDTFDKVDAEIIKKNAAAMAVAAYTIAMMPEKFPRQTPAGEKPPSTVP
jgi:hypothetical protein